MPFTPFDILYGSPRLVSTVPKSSKSGGVELPAPEHVSRKTLNSEFQTPGAWHPQDGLSIPCGAMCR